MKKPELLVPAGDLQKLKIGLMYGADAFYMGLAPFSMRSRINNFTKESLMEGVKLIRKAKKACYITINIFPRGNKVDSFKKHIKFLRDEVKPDALIIADPGVVELVKEVYPKAVIHMSVQANVLNYKAVEFWQKQGVKRIILPRELTMEEIKIIHEKVPTMELEFFVHGAICVAYSGRCLLSYYMTGRDANQGLCAHSCRWKYRLEEEQRPGEYMSIDEDEHGSYIMNSRDMCLLPYLKDLAKAGVCSFKVEGRNKTEYYLATITKAYRKAIDDMMKGRKFNDSEIEEVKKVANRGFIPGFLFGFPDRNSAALGAKSIHYSKNAPTQTHKFVGLILDCKKNGLYEVEIRNRLEKGQTVEIMTPDKQFELKINGMFDLDGKEISVAHGGAGNKLLKLEKGLPIGTMLRIKV